MIFPIISNSESSNCYMVIDEKAALIDSGLGNEMIEKIQELTGKFNTGIDFLINTHCHYDHAANDLFAREKWNAEIAMHEDEIINENSVLSHLFNKNFREIPVDIKLKENDAIKLGEIIELKVIHTPGHTKGGICLYDKETKTLFSGDTVFSDGIGRTDFPGGDFNELKASVEKILKLKQDSGIDKLCPGHGMIGTGEDIKRVYKMWF